MTTLLFLVCLGFFLAAGALICIKHDFPQVYDAIELTLRRLLIAVMIAVALSVAIVRAQPVDPYGCNDMEKYSFLWYAMGCFLWEHSS